MHRSKVRVSALLEVTAAVGAVFLFAACSSSPKDASAPKAQQAAPYTNPITVTAVAHPSARVEDLTMTTPALAFPVHVAVLLPTGYAQHPQARYPVIYLLHGGSAGPTTGKEYLEWLTAGDVEQITGDDQVIEVMPQGDTGGWYTDWVGEGKNGRPQWETFHVDQLVPFVDHRYRTIADRGRRAIVGLSMGGYGAVEYAARHPDVFGTAVSLSGAPDLADPPQEVGPTSTAIVGAMAVGNGGTPDSPFGSFDTDLINWRDHDPADLAENLRHTALFLSVGNGTPGPLDTPATATSFDETIEKIVDLSTSLFEQRLTALHIAYTADNYGDGTHSWPYWQRELRRWLPAIMEGFAHPLPARATISYTTADPAYSRWGWSVAVHRPAMEFSTLSNAGPDGFQLAGSGSATVTTPADFQPGSTHEVSVTPSDGSAAGRRSLRADAQGRLTIDVPLGPANPVAESSPAAATTGTRVFRTTVTVS